MPLKSKLLSGDAKLEACLVSDPAHVTPGSRGDHVKKIQAALNLLSDAGLDEDGVYGAGTAKAVTDYKNARGILQSYQTTADEIVGKRTIASLDSELLAKEAKPAGAFQVIVLTPTPRPAVYDANFHRIAQQRDLSSFYRPVAFSIGGGTKAVVIDPPKPATQLIRLKPRDSAQLMLVNPKGGASIKCVNRAEGALSRIAWVLDPDFPQDRLCPEPTGLAAGTALPRESGGELMIFMRAGDKALTLDGYQPGDAVLTATDVAGQQVTIQVNVRAVGAGPTGRTSLTKLAPGSQFFSASLSDGGEFDPDQLQKGVGRPVKVNTGGRLINLAGETETPGFWDYSVNLKYSGYSKSFTGDKTVFRPLVTDPDTSAGVAKGSASHICMRSAPFHDDTANAIKHAAQAGCFFTYYTPSTDDIAKAKAALGGTVLEEKVMYGGTGLALKL